MGPDTVAAELPPELQGQLEKVSFQMLLPTDESSLEPVSVASLRMGLKPERIAPAFWRIRGLGLQLADAVPLLARLETDSHRPGLRFLIRATQLVLELLKAGDFAPADPKGVLRFVPCWTEESIRCLGALAELIPTSHLTARFANQEDTVYAVTARNHTISFVGHALDACAGAYTTVHERAERLPRQFWQTRPQPVLEVMKPEKELEEGVPWGIRLLFRTVPGVGLNYSLERLMERQQDALFPDPLTAEALEDVEAKMERLIRSVPALRRAMNMADGRASLNRQELDVLLDHLPMLEAEGVEVSLPGLERMRRLVAKVTLREKDAGDGMRPWFQLDWKLAVGDQELSNDEFEALVNARSPLVQLGRGAVLLSPKDRVALTEFKKRAKMGGQQISFFEALRLKLGGAAHLHGLPQEKLDAGPTLEELAQRLDSARRVEDRPQPQEFHGELRPYQRRGHAWAYYLLDQGFGVCLADDMGLGKTIQAIAVLLDWRKKSEKHAPVLLACPVSVLGNWRRELHRFSPSLRVTMHHGKGRPRTLEEFESTMRDFDVILTSYNLLQRDEELFSAHVFGGVILDEAQNIKNPRTRQSRAARQLRGAFRMALTGTPLENRPLDLWSIMDFLNEGLLGSRTSFLQTLEHPIVKQKSGSTASTLARLVRPFVLRRLKTDPEIIHDLPEKSEQVVAASLTQEQAVLYEAVVRKGLSEVESAGEGIQRRGAILTTLLRLKQVCNHPAHYLGDGSPLPGRSGKLDLLMEMLIEALDEGDRCLVFTQFKEMGSLLKTEIENRLGNTVLFLHGGVTQKERESMVSLFQAGDEGGPRIFVLSLKAGGTGLNLTKANRVFHYDRWWNPAVEDQATDRAFRIGQQRNVFVHKFVCTGTLEERIQSMLERKREVADTLLGAGEGWLTELSNDELKRLLLLDRQEALA